MLSETINLNYCPDLKKTISKITLFEARQPIYALYIKETDRFIVLPEEKIDNIINISKISDGNNTIETIADTNKTDSKVTMQSIVMMYKLHLFDENNESQQFSEVTMLSKKMFNFPLVFSDRIGTFFYYVYWGILTALVLGFGIFALTNDFLTPEHVQNNISRFNGIGYLLSLVLNVPIFVIHEFAHVATACKYRLNKGLRIHTALYLYFFPYVYVKIPGLYTLKRHERIHVLVSGVAANIMLGILFISVNSITDQSIFISLALSNFQIALVNLMPFNLTDGYFICSNLLKRVNLRKKYFTFISNIGKKKSFTADKVEKSYLIVSGAYLLVFMYFEVRVYIASLFDEISGSELIFASVILTIAASMIYIFFIKLRIRKVMGI